MQYPALEYHPPDVVEFTVDDEWSAFANYLAGLRINDQVFPTQKGEFELLEARQVDHSVEFVGGHSALEGHTHRLIVFTLNPADKRTRVRAKCIQRAVRPYFYELLSKIADDYRPEALTGWLQAARAEAARLATATELSSSSNGPSDPQLTERELEIARYLAMETMLGKNDIAKAMVIDRATVVTHCKSLSEKWGLGTTKQEILWTEARRRIGR